LTQRPANLESLLKLLRNAGFVVERRGQNISLKAPDWKRPARLDTLGDEYGVEALIAVLSGKKEHRPRVKYARKTVPKRGTMLIDNDPKLQAGKFRISK
jgi:hypothetical protein